MPPLSPGRKGVALLLLGAAIMSFAPLLAKTDVVGPSAVAMYRQLWGGIALVIFAAVRGERLVPRLPLFLMLTLCSLFFTEPDHLASVHRLHRAGAFLDHCKFSGVFSSGDRRIFL